MSDDRLDLDVLLPLPADPAAELGTFPTAHVRAALGRVAEAHKQPSAAEHDLWNGALGQDVAASQEWWQELWMLNGEYAGALRDETGRRLRELRASGRELEE